MLGVEERKWLATAVAIVAAYLGQYYIAKPALAAAFIIGGAFVSGAIATQSMEGGLKAAFGAAITFGIMQGDYGYWGQAGAQAVTGGIMEAMQGGNFGHGFVAAGLTTMVMPVVGTIEGRLARTVAGAVVGGTLSEATGGKFANGAVSGAIQAAMMGGPSGAHATEGGEDHPLLSPSKEAQADFEKLRNEFYDANIAGFNTEQGAADAFQEAFMPFAWRYGLEVGANIEHFSNFSISDISLGTSHGVNIPVSNIGVADVHIHPHWGTPGLSGYLHYVGGRLHYDQDYGLNWQNHTNGYVYRVGGGAWRFDYQAFRQSYVQSVKTGADTYADWFTSPIK
jgi:hypothetical protein